MDPLHPLFSIALPPDAQRAIASRVGLKDLLVLAKLDGFAWQAAAEAAVRSISEGFEALVRSALLVSRTTFFPGLYVTITRFETVTDECGGLHVTVMLKRWANGHVRGVMHVDPLLADPDRAPSHSWLRTKFAIYRGKKPTFKSQSIQLFRGATPRQTPDIAAAAYAGLMTALSKSNPRPDGRVIVEHGQTCARNLVHAILNVYPKATESWVLRPAQRQQTPAAVVSVDELEDELE